MLKKLYQKLLWGRKGVIYVIFTNGISNFNPLIISFLEIFRVGKVWKKLQVWHISSQSAQGNIGTVLSGSGLSGNIRESQQVLGIL